jgi:ParB family transcriptional regulator, chromosome partitioning protein
MNMARKTGLGKGLDALIPSGPPEGQFQAAGAANAGGVIRVSVTAIEPNPHQPRTHFDPDELAELAASIHEHGILQPLLVTKSETPERYTLIAGERRWLAAKQAGLFEVPVLIREANELERVELALIENVQRADLGPLETAEAYRQLAEDFNLAHEQIATRVGKSRTTVTNTLRLLKLPDAIRKSLAEGQISEGHARALLALTTPQAQSAALQSILKNHLNVRQTEELVQKLSGTKPESPPKKNISPEITALERRLRDGLSTKVTLKQSRKGGTLVIHYYSQEELDSLVERILAGK